MNDIDNERKRRREEPFDLEATLSMMRENVFAGMDAVEAVGNMELHGRLYRVYQELTDMISTGTGTLSVGRVAKRAGLYAYDSALPQAWVDAVQKAIDCDPRGHFVWCYDGFVTTKGSDKNTFGYPHPITRRGIQIAGILSRGYDL